MKFIFLDFETFYAKDYTLRKMTPAEYILDPRFETICVSAKVDDGPTIFIDGPDFTQWLSQFDAKDCTVLTYNALFDMCILYWHYGFLPARMIDVLGMARTLLGWKLSRLSLAHVSEHLKVGTKYDTIHNVQGMHRADIIAGGWTGPVGNSLWEAFKLYAMNDTDLLYGVFNKLAPEFPKSEYRVMDLILRCAVAPRFVADVPMLEAHLADVRLTKENLLTQAGIGATTLQSAALFKLTLEALGVDVEMKAGKTGMIPAFAKTDDFMDKLLNHDDLQVQALAAARLGVKSTLEETRAAKLLRVAKLAWPRCIK